MQRGCLEIPGDPGRSRALPGRAGPAWEHSEELATKPPAAAPAPSTPHAREQASPCPPGRPAAVRLEGHAPPGDEGRFLGCRPAGKAGRWPGKGKRTVIARSKRGRARSRCAHLLARPLVLVRAPALPAALTARRTRRRGCSSRAVRTPDLRTRRSTRGRRRQPQGAASELGAGPGDGRQAAVCGSPSAAALAMLLLLLCYCSCCFCGSSRCGLLAVTAGCCCHGGGGGGGGGSRRCTSGSQATRPLDKLPPRRHSGFSTSRWALVG
jgi:hypothetical protein